MAQMVEYLPSENEVWSPELKPSTTTTTTIHTHTKKILKEDTAFMKSREKCHF
jgi:hypothetical protein